MILDDLAHPIVLAPLAGGPSTPALAAAVSNAGGLGFLAAGYKSPDAFAADLRELRGLTSRPFGVNLFVPGTGAVDHGAIRAYAERLAPEADRAGASLGDPHDDDDGWEAKLSLLRAERVPVVSFTFGCPSAEVIASIRSRTTRGPADPARPDAERPAPSSGAEAWVTVTTPAEARIAREAGADALVVQGVEAGGHRASFADDDEAEGFGLLALLRLVASEVDLPLVATGAIADGAGIAAVLVAGAAAAQLGTAFLRAPEAGTNAEHAAALAAETPTALTRAFTGRTARGLRNRFLEEHTAAAPRGYPHLHHLTAPLRAAARAGGDAHGFNLWAGQAHRLAREAPAAEIAAQLASEARAAYAAAAARFS